MNDWETCKRCRKLERERPIAATVAGDLDFRRRRRILLHVRFCETDPERAVRLLIEAAKREPQR